MHKNVKFIILIYQFFLLLPIFSSENIHRKLANKQYISAIYTGKGELRAVSRDSWATPLSAYMTSSNITIDVSNNYSDVKITVKDDENENNITLVFQNDVKNLVNLFEDLGHIKKVDLSRFKEKPEYISFMFYNCCNLEEVIFGNFDTSNVKSMYGMFYNTKVTSLDLSRFNTTKVEDMRDMFYNCNLLKYLDLKNFDFSGIKCYVYYIWYIYGVNNMFFGCNSLKYLNIYSFKDNACFGYDFILNWQSHQQNLIFCINETNAQNLSNYLNYSGFINNCSYFFRNNTNNNNISCDVEEEEDPTKDIQNVEKSIFDCSSGDFFYGQCEEINKNKSLSIEDKDNIITNIMNDIINGDLDSALDGMVEGNGDDLTRVQDDITFQITTTKNQDNNEYNNISTIHLGNCETILKNIYEIPFNLSLIILKVDYSMKDSNFLLLAMKYFIQRIKLN